MSASSPFASRSGSSKPPTARMLRRQMLYQLDTRLMEEGILPPEMLHESSTNQGWKEAMGDIFSRLTAEEAKPAPTWTLTAGERLANLCPEAWEVIRVRAHVASRYDQRGTDAEADARLERLATAIEDGVRQYRNHLADHYHATRPDGGNGKIHGLG